MTSGNDFDLILSKTRQALGTCLLTLDKSDANVTTVFSAMMWAVISLAKEAEEKSIKDQKLQLSVDFDLVVRYAALMISTNWKLEPEIIQKLKEIAFFQNKNNDNPNLIN